MEASMNFMLWSLLTKAFFYIQKLFKRSVFGENAGWKAV
ncbi:MAG: hypothetical protein PWP38_2008, partial [Clostridiales bacterium]|nr:hypothetical protein [Clostridiales bacterium]